MEVDMTTIVSFNLARAFFVLPLFLNSVVNDHDHTNFERYAVAVS